MSNTTMTYTAAINACTTLDELCDLLNELHSRNDEQSREMYDATIFNSLPLFSDNELQYSERTAWSWDDTRYLIQAHTLEGEWQIVSREDLD